MAESQFENNIFINCPLDNEYAPILQAILFCVIYLGYSPRIATERNNSAESRIDKIRSLLEESKYSIHDLSRCQAKKAGEHFRLNMPFELGIDYGCRQYFGNGRGEKKFIILEEKKFRYQAALSDISGCDIKIHNNDPQKAIRQVRNWLVSEAGIDAVGASTIYREYTVDFSEWYFEKQLKSGFNEDDIRDYPTNELMTAMLEWKLV